MNKQFFFSKIAFYIPVKKLLAILLFFVLLFNSTGYYFSFMTAEISAKSHAWLMRIEPETDDDVVSLKFKTHNGNPVGAELNFINENEFTYQGKRYDLISMSEANGIVTFKCYCDTKESAAITDLNRQIENHKGQPANSPTQSPLKNLFKYYTAHNHNRFVILPPAILYLFHTSHTLPAVAVFHNIITPPPDTFIA